jgi:hypothetical protein
MFMNVYIYIYLCIYIYMYIYTYIDKYMYIHIEEDNDLSCVQIHKGQRNVIKNYPYKEEKKPPSPLKNKQNQEKIDIENEKKVDLMLQNHQLYKGERTDNIDEQDKYTKKKKMIKKKVHRSARYTYIFI